MTAGPPTSPVTDDERTSSVGLWHFAQSYVQAADHLAAALDGGSVRLRFDDPVYYLYGHGSELALKAYLRARGLGLTDLKKIGHGCTALFASARERPASRRWPHPKSTVAVLGWFDSMSSDGHRLRYVKTGFSRRPELAVVARVAHALLTSTHREAVTIAMKARHPGAGSARGQRS